MWVGVEMGNNKLKELSKRINNTLNEFSASENKSFSPHVTMGRIRISEKNFPYDKFISTYSQFKTPVSSVPGINLYRSILSPEGASYQSLQKFYFSDSGF